MALLHVKGPLEKAAESVDAGQLLKTAARSTLEQALGQQPAPANPKPVGRMAKPGLMIAGGIAGVTAASAAVSAVRRKQGEG